MSVVERAAIAPSHGEVVGAWREIMDQASALDLADRIVIAVKLRAKADALAVYEGLARDAEDLARDVRAFAVAVRVQNPLTKVFLAVGLASGMLGFLGLWSFLVVTSTAEMAQTTAALVGVLTAASGVVVVAVVRGAVEAARAAVEELSTHPSTVLLEEVRAAEEHLFGIFGQRVPEPPISAVPLVVLGVAGAAIGLVVAALAGVGTAA
ncbi:hypothetical protein E1218_35810 [Kribbella turkmenica]|uniref:Uncharacterized protein n=1 Tax=Kribbella turkmenica TaxID=2530375 RepID=A0A4R4W048_9ACTN|nr:hypothetical protein [Kribbella turkmenica]TDD11151.1 hypothetical protein E1218_35810 [Kribbella turkmenica]